MKKNKMYLLQENCLKKFNGGVMNDNTIKHPQDASIREFSDETVSYVRPYKTGALETNLLSETPRTF